MCSLEEKLKSVLITSLQPGRATTMIRMITLPLTSGKLTSLLSFCGPRGRARNFERGGSSGIFFKGALGGGGGGGGGRDPTT